MKLNTIKILLAITRNFLHKIRFTTLLRKIFRFTERGGHRLSELSIEKNAKLAVDIFKLFHPYLPNLKNKIGLEIGPGENIGVAYSFLKHGASHISLIEKFDSINLNKNMIKILDKIDSFFPNKPNINKERLLKDKKLTVEISLFEETYFPSNTYDFIYSNDVMEHISDSNLIFKKAKYVLKNQGIFINNIDLSGHNIFSNPKRPLDFLTCPDWLWSLMFSNIETTNRIRLNEFMNSAKRNGFKLLEVKPIIKIDLNYIKEIQPYLLDRYKEIDVKELEIIQCLLVTQKIN